MSKKLYLLISAISQAVGIVGSALITYFQPPYWGAWIGVVDIVCSGVTAGCLLFVKPEDK